MAYRALLTGVVAASAAPAALAGIGYDNLTGNSSQAGLYHGNGEVADDMLLDLSSGLTITAATIRIREATVNLMYSGTLRMSVYADGGTQPGALLTTASVPVVLPPTLQMDVLFDFPDATSPTPVVWTSWHFEFPGQSNGTPVAYFGGTPTVGSTTARTAWRSGGVGEWTVSDTAPNAFLIRLETVPGPGAAAMLGAGVLMAGLRRRRGRPRDRQ